jgi:hypothetical protein
VNKKESPSNKPSYIDLVPEAFLKAWEVKKCSAWSLKRVQNDIDRFVIEIKRYNNIRALLYICTAILLIAVYAFHHNQTRFGELTKLSSFAFVLVFIFAVFYQINSDIHEKVSSFEFKLINDGSWIDSFDDYVKSLLVNEKSDPFTSLTPNSMMARMVSIAQQVLLLEDRIKDLRINLKKSPGRLIPKLSLATMNCASVRPVMTVMSGKKKPNSISNAVVKKQKNCGKQKYILVS